MKPEFPAYVFWFYVVLGVTFLTLAAVIATSQRQRVVNQVAAWLMALGGLWAFAHGSIFFDADYAAKFIRVSVAISGPFVAILWMLRGAIWDDSKSIRELIHATRGVWVWVTLLAITAFSPYFIPYESTWQTELRGPLWTVVRFMPAAMTSILLIAAWRDRRKLSDLAGIRRFEAQIVFIGGSIAALIASFRSFYRQILTPDQTALVSGTVILIFFVFLIYGIFSKRIFDAASVGIALTTTLAKFIFSVSSYLAVSALGKHWGWPQHFSSLLSIAAAIATWVQAGRLLPKFIKSKADETCSILRKNIENSGQYYSEEEKVLSVSLDAIKEWLAAESCWIFVNSIRGWQAYPDSIQIPNSMVSSLRQKDWISTAALERSWNRKLVEITKPWLRRHGVDFAVKSDPGPDDPEVIIAVSPHTKGRPYSYQNMKRTAAVANSVGIALRYCRLGLKGRERGKAQAIQLIAAGLGHDLKQHTASFGLFAELLETRHSEAQFRDKFLPHFRTQVETLATYSAKMIEIGNPSGPNIEAVELNTIMDSILKEIGIHPAAQGIQIKSDFEAPSLMWQIDSSLLRRACVNLCLNSIQAMHAQPDCADHSTLEITLNAGDDSVRICIQDNGPGLPPHIRTRLFEPFVRSTQPGGSGLGLYLAWDAVIQMGGTLHHEDRSPAGTRFLITLYSPKT